MENQQNYSLAPFDYDTFDQQNSANLQENIESLQKTLIQSFKYCKAKTSKNQYIRSTKIEEIKQYQRKLIAIVKKKSEETVTTLIEFSQQIIDSEQLNQSLSEKKEQQNIKRLRGNITTLSNEKNSSAGNNSKSILMRQKLKRITYECESQLQRMESEQRQNQHKKHIQTLINEMQKPFKKLCTYFCTLKKQMKRLQQEDQSQKQSSFVN